MPCARTAATSRHAALPAPGCQPQRLRCSLLGSASNARRTLGRGTVHCDANIVRLDVRAIRSASHRPPGVTVHELVHHGGRDALAIFTAMRADVPHSRFSEGGMARRNGVDVMGKYLKAWALNSVAELLAATDPDRAEDIARSIGDQPSKASALSSVAKVLAAESP